MVFLFIYGYFLICLYIVKNPCIGVYFKYPPRQYKAVEKHHRWLNEDYYYYQQQGFSKDIPQGYFHGLSLTRYLCDKNKKQ